MLEPTNEALFSGRVPHVRTSVPGRKRRGVAPSNAVLYRPRANFLAPRVKALEESVFGPCTLARIWAPVHNLKPWIKSDPSDLAVPSETQFKNNSALLQHAGFFGSAQTDQAINGIRSPVR